MDLPKQEPVTSNIHHVDWLGDIATPNKPKDPKVEACFKKVRQFIIERGLKGVVRGHDSN